MLVAENRIRNTGPFTSESQGVSLHTLFENFHLVFSQLFGRNYWPNNNSAFMRGEYDRTSVFSGST